MKTYEVKSPNGKPLLSRFGGTLHTAGEKLVFDPAKRTLQFLHEKAGMAQHEAVALVGKLDLAAAQTWIEAQEEAGKLVAIEEAKAEPVKPAVAPKTDPPKAGPAKPAAPAVAPAPPKAG